MFTPRQVSVGNKVYQLHIKHEAKKATIDINPDRSIHQLKEQIQSQFDVKPDEQSLLCNGKVLDVSDNVTLKQAKIPNGSKISCSKVKTSKAIRSSQDSSKIGINETLKKLESIEEKADSLEKGVHALDKKRKKLKHSEVPLFHGDQTGDLKRLKLDCGKNGELLMQLLESVDQMSLSEGQAEERGKRKQVATKINAVLDKNDKIIEKLSLAIKKAG